MDSFINGFNGNPGEKSSAKIDVGKRGERRKTRSENKFVNVKYDASFKSFSLTKSCVPNFFDNKKRSLSLI